MKREDDISKLKVRLFYLKRALEVYADKSNWKEIRNDSSKYKNMYFCWNGINYLGWGEALDALRVDFIIKGS